MIFRLLITTILVLSCVACVDPVQRNVEKMDEYVARVESESAEYDESDWEQANLEFEAMQEQVYADYDSMTEEQQDAAMRAIGRYYGLLAKQGIETFTKEAKRTLEAVPSIIEGFTDAFKE